MTEGLRPRSHTAKLWQLALLFVCVQPESGAVPQDAILQRSVEQRLTLASHLIEKMAQSEKRRSLSDELGSLRARLLTSVDDSLPADANAFLRKVIGSYQGVATTTKGDDVRHRRRYETKLAEVEAFREAFEALLRERGDVARATLDVQVFNARLAKARDLAARSEFMEAYTAADDANHQLISALKTLRHEETIEYRLDFASAEDEYAYETRRFASQKVLLQMLIAESEPSDATRELIDTLVVDADALHSGAETMAAAGHFEQAVSELEKAIEALNRAMRISGVYF